MSTKFYRVIKDNFLWEKGAILQNTASGSTGQGYQPISDIWDTTEHNSTEYISAKIIESNPEWFERVYQINLLSKTVYKLKAEAKEFTNKEFKGE